MTSSSLVLQCPPPPPQKKDQYAGEDEAIIIHVPVQQVSSLENQGYIHKNDILCIIVFFDNEYGSYNW